MNYELTWDIAGNPGNFGFGLINTFNEMVRNQMPEFQELFPFKSIFKAEIHLEDGLFCAEFTDTKAVSSMAVIGEIKDQKKLTKYREIISSNDFPSFEEVFSCLGDDGFAFEKFTYVGKAKNNNISWPHISSILVDWTNQIVIPKVYEYNKKRVQAAIPTPPNFNLKKILDNIFVIESELGTSQGTAFYIKDKGFITCDHCVRNWGNDEFFEDLVLFRGNDHGKKYPIKIIHANKTIDLAIFDCGIDLKDIGLDIGKADELKQMDHLGISGFPNYNFGDSGYFSPGIITGFRTYHGLRHILVNSPIIAGNSGGPAVDSNNKVIGIAVTGADKMYTAHETEKHGLIPIEALEFLKS